MSEVSFIGQVAMGDTSAHQLKDLFPALTGGNAFSIKCVSGSITLGLADTVTASTGYPIAAGDDIIVEAQSARRLWAIGGATDRIAILTV